MRADWAHVSRLAAILQPSSDISRRLVQPIFETRKARLDRPSSASDFCERRQVQRVKTAQRVALGKVSSLLADGRGDVQRQERGPLRVETAFGCRELRRAE